MAEANKVTILADEKDSERVTSELDSVPPSEEGVEPTEEEMKNLRRVAKTIPLSCWLVALVELAERFSYYGLSTPFQNYMQNTPDDDPHGKLGLDQHGATALSYFWQFWCYVTPIFGAWVADTYFGKFNTICIFSVVYILGIFVLFITSIPSIADRDASLAGFIIAVIVIGLGTGGVKANVSPLIADQVPKFRPFTKVLKSGEKVIVDTNITVQNVFMLFYLMVNVGSLSIIATSALEQEVDFWAAFLLPLCFFSIVLFSLVFGKKFYVKVPVGDKVIARSFKVGFIALSKLNFDAARPSLHPEKEFPWDDLFVSEVQRAFYACKVFFFYPIYWLTYGQMANNFVSMAGDMDTHGLPNDVLQAINPLTIIIFIPICERFVYPFIRRFTPLRAITKIFIGFMFATASMVYAAVLQHFIYQAGPCYDDPKGCAPEFAKVPNDVHIALQTPAYFFMGMSEIFASITGLEYAYTKAPVSMKSFIMSIFLVQNAFGSALGIALSPVSRNPKMVWNYTGLAVSCFIAGWIFWFLFKHYNYREDDWNNLEYEHEEQAKAIEAARDEEKAVEAEPLNPVTSLTVSYRDLR
ncbi:hypothetical protein FT663_00168 [Candidozyma haemuli var. vulneris]|uniref:Peptide transporter PTR2 n=1 Tax=Candidozyma haemuli TaxID=45357 RepID=A0A2V1AM13_9ASCO|nr:hypothetical protein CXQ85_001038 [[Candida] haemuloni]KAF3994198.1 hypothetical protein FT662_00067 [[Candida] haemuloni var. vulneris]KAF3995746.1 hypothetical protein FT663_00168 [[Candida] haemuloni var. vulneris]PVH18752.1 hypothetical protein CXQ85_001038 [[Candida] haemuloni]